MAFVITGISNTPTDPVTGARSLVPQPINYNSDYRVISESGNEAVLACLQTPIEAPETIRISFSEVTDMFKGTKLDPTLDGGGDAVKKGCSILVQLNGVGKDSEAVAGLNDIWYPYSIHMVLKLPYGPSPAAADVIALVERFLGHLYDTGESAPTTRLAALLRGANTPVDL